MNTTNILAGTPVYCRDGRLGTLVSIGGDNTAPALIVRTDDGGQVVAIPAKSVADTSGGQVRLRDDCATVMRLAQPVAADALNTEMSADTVRIPLIEERLVSSTQWREAGTLEIARRVRSEVQELDVPLRYEEASVERVAVNRVLADGEELAPRQDGDTLIVPVVQEELVVTKRRVLVEELRITRQIQTRTQHVAEEVRREEVELTHPGLDSHTAAN